MPRKTPQRKISASGKGKTPRGQSRKTISAVQAKLQAIRAAARHAYPIGDIDQVLAEIEQGKSTSRNS